MCNARMMSRLFRLRISPYRVTRGLAGHSFSRPLTSGLRYATKVSSLGFKGLGFGELAD